MDARKKVGYVVEVQIEFYPLHILQLATPTSLAWRDFCTSSLFKYLFTSSPIQTSTFSVTCCIGRKQSHVQTKAKLCKFLLKKVNYHGDEINCSVF